MSSYHLTMQRSAKAAQYRAASVAGGGAREIARRTRRALYGKVGSRPAGILHPHQSNSHGLGMMPNHCLGIPSYCVSRGASTVTRHQANTQGW